MNEEGGRSLLRDAGNDLRKTRCRKHGQGEKFFLKFTPLLAGPPRADLVPGEENFFGSYIKGEQAENLNTKSERPTLNCRVT